MSMKVLLLSLFCSCLLPLFSLAPESPLEELIASSHSENGVTDFEGYAVRVYGEGTFNGRSIYELLADIQ